MSVRKSDWAPKTLDNHQPQKQQCGLYVPGNTQTILHVFRAWGLAWIWGVLFACA